MRAASCELPPRMRFVLLVVLRSESSNCSLRLIGHRRRSIQIQNRRTLAANDDALIGRRHVTTGPVLGSADRPAFVVEHHHETRADFRSRCPIRN